MTGYSVGLSACKKEGREKLRWLTVILGAKALQAITRAAASPVRRFENWRCSRTSPLYDNETSKKWDTINATHADNVSAHPPSAANIVSLSSMPMGYSNALDSPLHRRLSSFSLSRRYHLSHCTVDYYLPLTPKRFTNKGEEGWLILGQFSKAR